MDNSQPAMSLANGNIGNTQGQELPQQAIKAADKVVNKYWNKHAEDIANQPGGIDILHHLVNQYASPGGLNNAPKVEPASGMFSSANVTPEGNIQNSGALAGIFGTNTAALLKNLLTISNIQQNTSQANLQVAEKSSAQAEVGLKNKVGKFLDKGSQIVSVNPNTGEIGNSNDPASMKFLMTPTLNGPAYVQLDKNADVTSHLNQLDTLLKNEADLRSGWQKFWNTQTPAIKDIRGHINKTISVLQGRLGTNIDPKLIEEARKRKIL